MNLHEPQAERTSPINVTPREEDPLLERERDDCPGRASVCSSVDMYPGDKDSMDTESVHIEDEQEEEDEEEGAWSGAGPYEVREQVIDMGVGDMVREHQEDMGDGDVVHGYK